MSTRKNNIAQGSETTTKRGLNKKWVLAAILLLVTLSMALVLGLGGLNIHQAFAAESINNNPQSRTFYANAGRSVEIYEDVMSLFRSNNSTNSTANADTENFVYCDSFAGVFIDDYGFLNVGIVSSDGQNISLNALHNFGGQVVFRPKTYSYNHLNLIKSAIADIAATQEVYDTGGRGCCVKPEVLNITQHPRPPVLRPPVLWQIICGILAPRCKA